MPGGSVNSVISRTGGRRNIGSLPCAMRRRARRRRRRRRQKSNTSCCRNQPVQIPGLCVGHALIPSTSWSGLQPAGWRGKPDQRGEQRYRTGVLYPSARFDVNGNHFQLAMLAYNLRLLADAVQPRACRPTPTQCTTRLWPPRGYVFLFVAAKIWRHAGRTAE